GQVHHLRGRRRVGGAVVGDPADHAVADEDVGRRAPGGQGDTRQEQVGHAGPIVAPPLTIRFWPVTIRAWGPARYATACAMSLGRIGVVMHWPRATCWRYSAGTVCSVTSVVTSPGLTELTAIPYGPSSLAIARVMPTTAPLDAT